MVKDLRTLLDHERYGPGEEIHEVRQQVGMWAFHELLDVEGVILGGERGTSNFMTAALLL